MNATDSSSNSNHSTFVASQEPGEGAASAMDAEDQMAQALDALRQERAETGGDAQAPTAAMPAGPDGGMPAVMGVGADSAGTDAAQARAHQAAAQQAGRDGRPDPAELLRRTQEELHKARSEMGRVGQLNRYLNQARAERDRLLQENAQLKGSSGKAAAPGTQGDSSAAASARLAELSQKVQQFPELQGLVGAVQQALQAVDAKAATVAEQTAARMVEPLHGLRAEHEQRAQEQRSAAYQAAMQTFEATYPNAVEVVRSADFSAWIGTQPQPIQAAFYQGQDPGEAIAVMDAYDAHLRRAGRAPIARYPQQPAAQRASTNAARLQSAAGLPSRASGAKGGLPPEDDFETSLDFFRRQRLNRAG